MDNRPIGVFDSGVGGFSVVKEILKIVPNEEIVYFGDTARAPYGGRLKYELSLFAKQTMRFLISQNCKAVVAACNTTCATCLSELSDYGLPVIEVLTPAVKEAAQYNKIGLFATKATVAAAIHEKEIKKINPRAQISGVSCDKLVPLIESGHVDSPEIFAAVAEYLELLGEVECLILGCTHYPLIKNAIEKIANEKIANKKIAGGVKLIDPANGAAQNLKTVLEKSNAETAKKNPRHKFFYSGKSYGFELMLKSQNIDSDVKIISAKF
jgi:glutamate racemase